MKIRLVLHWPFHAEKEKFYNGFKFKESTTYRDYIPHVGRMAIKKQNIKVLCLKLINAHGLKLMKRSFAQESR